MEKKTGEPTIPPLSDITIHRFDLLKERMTETNPLDPILAKIGEALKRRKRVWLVGWLPEVEGKDVLEAPPPAPHPVTGWRADSYFIYWRKK